VQIANSREYSSLPLILAISSAIVVSASGGWLVMGNNSTASTDNEEHVTAAALAVPTPDYVTATTSIDIDAELRKARLSADADLLVAPPRQNAMYFYGRVLSADPQHPLANAELDALLALISLIVDDHLAANEFDDAYDLAMSVARHKPDHPLVNGMRDDLNSYAARLADQASKYVNEGNDDEAAATLEALEGLRGLNPEFVASAREAVLSTQQSRVSAEREQIEAEQLASEQADLEWAKKVRDAIDLGFLIAPEGENARDYLAERDGPAEVKEQLHIELQDALVAASQNSLDAGELAEAETYLIAASDFGGDDDVLTELRDSLEIKLIEVEGSTVVALAEFVRLSTASAEYPTRATKRNLTGWVDIAFTVTSTGQTANIEILRAEPLNVFESSAVEAVEKWTFVPRQYRGQPIDQRTAARLVFNLE